MIVRFGLDFDSALPEPVQRVRRPDGVGGRSVSTNIRFISAGAGSGKTFRLTEELEKALSAGRAAPAGVVGTSFTNKAVNRLSRNFYPKPRGPNNPWNICRRTVRLSGAGSTF